MACWLIPLAAEFNCEFAGTSCEEVLFPAMDDVLLGNDTFAIDAATAGGNGD